MIKKNTAQSFLVEETRSRKEGSEKSYTSACTSVSESTVTRVAKVKIWTLLSPNNLGSVIYPQEAS